MTDLPHLDDALPLHIAQLWTYPIKSCAGVRVPRTELHATGLAWDRAWMLVDADGEFVSQRELPRLALVQPRLHADWLEVTAPGMRALRLALRPGGEPRRVRVWDDQVAAWDVGDVAAQWFHDFLWPAAHGAWPRVRLVRFDPSQPRWSSTRWTGGVQAPNQFNDGFPVLVLSLASLADLNERLTWLGHPLVGVERFRPNVVIGGVESHDEDRLSVLRFGAGGAPGGVGVELQPVKPCARCSIPDIDPATAAPHPSVGQVLHSYRQDRRLMGAITFGMNAIVRSGAGMPLHEGMAGHGVWDAWG